MTDRHETRAATHADDCAVREIERLRGALEECHALSVARWRRLLAAEAENERLRKGLAAAAEQPAPTEAEVEALRAEVERVTCELMDAITRAERLEEALRELEKREQRDEALLRQTLDALEILRDGLLQMKEHAEDYGKRWAAAYIKELRDLSPGLAEEKFDLLGILQDRLAAVSMGVRKGYAAIIALRERLVEGKEQA